MADSYDGSLRFNTELDNSGFEQGSDKLLQAIKSLQQSVENIGQNMSAGLNSVTQSLQNLSNNAVSANQAVSQSGQEAVTTNQQIAQSANAAAEATQRMSTAPRNVNTEYSSIERTITSLGDQLTRLGTQARIGFNSEGQVLRFNDSVGIVARRVQELRDRLAALAEVRTPTEEFTNYQEIVNEAQQSLEGLIASRDRLSRLGIGEENETFRTIIQSIEQATQRLNDFQGRIQELEATGRAFTLGSDTAEYQNIAGQLAALEPRLGAVISAGQRAAHAFNGITSALGRMGRAMGNAVVHAFTATVQRLGAGLRAIGGAARRAVAGLFNFNRATGNGINPINGLIRGLTSFRTLLAQRVKNAIMSEVYKSFQEGIQKFAEYSSAFNQAMSNIKNTGAQIGAQVASLVAGIITAVEPVLTRILSLINSVITALSALFAKLGGKSTVAVATKGTQSYADSLKSAAGGAGKAAKEQKKFNAELYGWDELTRQNKQEDTSGGGGGGAGASGPSWTEVPVKDLWPDDIDWFQKSFEWAEKFADALDSIPWDSIQEGARKAGTAIAQFLNGVFANLHLARSLGTTIAQAFNTAFDFALAFLKEFDFAQFGVWAGTLWNAFVEAFDFADVRETIKLAGNGLITALANFFETIERTCSTLGAGLAEIFNGIFADIDLQSLAYAFMLGLHDLNVAIQAFIDGVEWDKIAANIKSGLNTLIKGMVFNKDGELVNVWAENGKVVGELIGKFVSLVYDIVTGLEWETLGSNLAAWLSNAIKGIDLTKLFGIFVQAFNGLVKMIGGFVRGMDWIDLGKNLGESLVNAIKMIDWKNFGKTVGDLLIAALGLLAGFVQGVDWLDLARSIIGGIGEALVNVDWLSLMATLGALLVGVIEGALELMLGAIAGCLDGLSAAFDALGCDSIAGFFKGISDALSGVGAWLKEHIVDPVVNGVKEMLGINSPSTVFAEIGTNLIAGLLQGISEAWHTITDFFSEVLGTLFQTISDKWEEIKTTTLETYTQIKDTIMEKWEEIKAIVSEKVESIKADLAEKWETIKADLSEKVETIKAEITQKWEEIKTTVATTVENIKTDTIQKWENIKQTVSATVENLKQDIQNKWNDVKQNVSTTANNIKQTVTDRWNETKQNASTAISNIKSTAETNFNNIKTSVSNSLDTMKQNALTNWETMKSTAATQFENIRATVQSKMEEAESFLKNLNWSSIGTDLIEGFFEGVKEKWERVKEWVSDAAESLTRTVKDAFDINSPSKVWMQIGTYLDEGLADGLQGGERSLLNAASGIATSLNQRMQGAEMDISTDADLERLDVIMDKLSGIASIIDHIAEALAAMGGLEIPQIAIGQVVPPKTRVGAPGTMPEESYTVQDEATSELVQLVRNIRDFLSSNSGGRPINLTATVDGRVLFQTVVDENNRAINRTGASPIRV